MTLASVLIVAAGRIGIGLYGALSQQSFVMLMMGLELMLNGVLLVIIGFWSFALAGAPEGQLLAIVIMAVMAVEMAIGFALVVAVYRKRRSEEHTSELQSLMRISYAVFCLKKKRNTIHHKQ